ncbi:unnamed protein product [Agarophyton chilense]
MDSSINLSKLPRSFFSDKRESLIRLLRDTVEASVTCLKVLILSYDEWITPEKAEFHGFSSKIRTFASGGTLLCVEVKLKDYTAWDHFNIEQVLLWGLSMSVVVFRFFNVERLGNMMEASKQITMRYPGSKDEAERVLYVESSSVDAVGQLRKDIKRAAISRRMTEPREEEDILFENSYNTKSICNKDVAGESHELMTTIARIFNR